MEGLEVRKKNPRDETEIHFLISQIQRSTQWPPHWPVAQIESECSQADGLVARDPNGELAAFVLFRKSKTVWEITFLATAPQKRAQGKMTSLLKCLVADLPHDVELWLEVHEVNSAARKLYVRCGFREVGRRAKYYPDGGAAILYNYG